MCFINWGHVWFPWQRCEPVSASMAELKFKWNALGLGIKGALNKVLTLCLQVFYEIPVS